MKKLMSILLSVSLVAVAFAGCSRVKEVSFSPDIKQGDISVVTFNVAAPWGNAIKGTGSGARVKRFAAYMNAVKPDTIGTQEMNSDWLSELEPLMPEYSSYGVKRGGDDSEKKSEINAVFWLKDKYECVLKNTFWLSETPDKESKYEGAGCYRICTYVMLRDKATGKYILHMNTHLDNASDEARVYGAKVIMDKLEEIRRTSSKYGFSVVLTGDFNDIEGSNPVNTVSNVLKSCSSANPENKKSSYTDWGKLENDGEPIDFIFTDGKPVGYMVLDDTSNGLVSDHYGVYSSIALS